ncbi:uncharacterized protein LOC120336422 [Styela clava]
MGIYSSTDFTRFIATVLLILHITATSSVGEGALTSDLYDLVRNFSSTQKPRICQIYSRSTGKHIQIINKKVSACGEDGDEYSEMEKTSHTFGVVTIRGVKSGRYLCMSKRGKLITKKKLPRDNSCKFVENMTSLHYTSYRSERDRNWYIGFNGKTGRGKKGKRTSPHQEACKFMIRDSEDHEHSNELPTYMQEVALKIQRRIRFGPPLTRKRRHRFQTEDPMEDDDKIDDEVMDTLTRLIGSPSSIGSAQDRQEWMLRVENFLKNYSSASVLNTTLSAFDLISPEKNPATPDPAMPNGRRRNKQRNKVKKPCRGRKRSKCPKVTETEGPTEVPSRKKVKSAMVPKTPTRPFRVKVTPESPTLASPLLSRLSKYDTVVSSPKISVTSKTDNHAQTRRRRPKGASSSLETNLNKTNTDNLHKDNLSRTVPPSPAPKVASSNSRRSRNKSKRGRNKQKHSRRPKDSS